MSDIEEQRKYYERMMDEVGTEYRRRIADLQAENEELRAENAHLWESVQNAEHEESVAWDRVRSAERRNEKLRELLQRLLAEYRYLRVRPRKMYLQHEARMRAIEEEMRELGIEVDA